jgi:thioredoxin-related protein
MRLTTYMSLTLILFFSNKIYSQNIGIHFENNLSWSKVKKKAKKQRKYIFMDVYATSCGPCIAMDQLVYSEPAMGELMNQTFISIKVQHNKTKNDEIHLRSWHADAEKLTRKYQIESLPTFMFFSPKGKLMYKETGYRDTATFREMTTVALTNPLKIFNTQLKWFKKGKRDSAFLYNLTLQALANGQDEIADISSRYIRQLKAPLAKKNIEHILRLTKKSSDPGFIFILQNLDSISTVVGKAKVFSRLRNIIGKEDVDPYLAKNAVSPNWDSLKLALRAKYGEIGAEKVRGEKMIYYLTRKDWEKFGNAYADYYNTAIQNSEYHINNISWKIFENVSDSKILAIAVEATCYNVKNFSQNNPEEMDTYANLLYKIGKIDQAIEIEQEAVILSNNAKEFVETLSKMKKREPTWPVPESMDNQRISN